MFAYCGNAPVGTSDPFGTMAGGHSCYSVYADYSYKPENINNTTGDADLDSIIEQAIDDIANREYNDVSVKDVSVSYSQIPHRGPTNANWLVAIVGAGISVKTISLSFCGIGGLLVAGYGLVQLSYKDSLYEDGNYPGCFVQIKWAETVYQSYHKESGVVYVHNTTIYCIKYNGKYQIYPFLGEDEIADYYSFAGGSTR